MLCSKIILVNTCRINVYVDQRVINVKLYLSQKLIEVKDTKITKKVIVNWMLFIIIISKI